MLMWDEEAWEQYQEWLIVDKKIVKRINKLILDIMRIGNTGIGKPEPLKHDLQGYWSRRITDEHRLVYSVKDKDVIIIKCRFHYE